MSNMQLVQKTEPDPNLDIPAAVQQLVADTFEVPEMLMIIEHIRRQRDGDKIPAHEIGEFILLCHYRKLNPLKNQIYAIPRKRKDKVYLSAETSIGGLTSIAQRTGECTGMECKPVYYKDGSVRGAVAIVQRKGHEYKAWVPFREYDQGTPIWRNKPETMIMKCAKAAALRMAFPEDTEGLYTSDEMPAVSEHEQTQPVVQHQPKQVETKQEPDPPAEPEYEQSVQEYTQYVWNSLPSTAEENQGLLNEWNVMEVPDFSTYTEDECRTAVQAMLKLYKKSDVPLPKRF